MRLNGGGTDLGLFGERLVRGGSQLPPSPPAWPGAMGSDTLSLAGPLAPPPSPGGDLLTAELLRLRATLELLATQVDQFAQAFAPLGQPGPVPPVAPAPPPLAPLPPPVAPAPPPMAPLPPPVAPAPPPMAPLPPPVAPAPAPSAPLQASVPVAALPFPPAGPAPVAAEPVSPLPPVADAPLPPPAGPAPLPAQPASPPTPAAPRPSTAATYRVLPGDSLSTIAGRVLGNPDRWQELYALNRDALGPDPDLLRPGQVLRLPGGTAAPSPAAVSTEAPRAGKAPYINQIAPKGRDGRYTNGSANCGPTSMAMVARAIGYGAGMTDAELIMHLGRAGGTSGNGTDVGGIARMARAMGVPCETRGPGAQVDWMAQQLRAGNLVVANGDYYELGPDRNPNATSGHYVTVYGMDGDDFLVHDPADRAVDRVSRFEMERFIRSNPNGGYQFSIGRA